MYRAAEVKRAARDAVIANRFRNAPPPVNPHRKDTKAHVLWDMAAGQAERAAARLLEIGA